MLATLIVQVGDGGGNFIFDPALGADVDDFSQALGGDGVDRDQDLPEAQFFGQAGNVLPVAQNFDP